MKQSSFDATISALDAETSSFNAETRQRLRSRGVTGDIGDCEVGITQQMCNRVTNLGDMSTFSKPVTEYYTHLSCLDEISLEETI